VNHSWHATLYVTVRGLSTSIIPDGPGGIEVAFDLLDHAVVGSASDGRTERFALAPMSVAEFHARFLALIGGLGGTPEFDGRPNEIPDPVPFTEDRAERPYDRDAVMRFFQALVEIDRVLKQFRTSYLGKVSPVHLFWGSFDMAVTRFSGRRAPPRAGADPVTREAYSHEVISFGFWSGDDNTHGPAFYSYTAPEPAGLTDQPLHPAAATWRRAPSGSMALLGYDQLRDAQDPKIDLLAFLQSAYDAGVRTAGWDHEELTSSFCPSPAELQAFYQHATAPQVTQ
jgi:hypothetical protein